ncbi:MAG: biotin synthase BioB [Magnetococcales bacterium]|nr:biotin synthase BioB [Magnetococcales bacterium]
MIPSSSPNATAAADLFLPSLAEQALAGGDLAPRDGLRILTDPGIPLLPLLHAAFRVRERHFGRGVRVHVLLNAQNGACPEDCHYCAQSAASQAPIVEYPLKSDAEILDGARRAHESGAWRYCVVLSGREPPRARLDHLARVVTMIKERHPVEVCLSAGFLDREGARRLKAAGLDRYNHNLNTAAGRYQKICSTHGYADRVATLEAARAEGLEVCSGIIAGMGETPEELVEAALTLRRLNARSIPVNFYVHVPGNRLGAVEGGLSPEFCLRLLCLFRFANPDAEVRAAGGREVHLRSLEPLALYPANSLFAGGYLNVGGDPMVQVRALVADAGFFIERVEEE